MLAEEVSGRKIAKTIRLNPESQRSSQIDHCQPLCWAAKPPMRGPILKKSESAHFFEVLSGVEGSRNCGTLLHCRSGMFQGPLNIDTDSGTDTRREQYSEKLGLT